MNVHIVTVSYDKDLEWLKYCINSIKTFCKNYTGHSIIIDNNENDCTETQKYLDSINYNYFINTQARHIKQGYVRQQYIKFYTDLYVPDDTDYICHVDSDSIFYEVHKPDVYFSIDKHKPDMLMTSYNYIFEKRQNDSNVVKNIQRWKKIASDFIKSDVEFEFMRRMPLLYKPDRMKKMREFVTKEHGCDILTYLKDKKTFTEYNCFGAFLHKHFNNDYTWIDTVTDNHLLQTAVTPMVQNWSKSDINKKRELIESLINEPDKLSRYKNKLINTKYKLGHPSWGKHMFRTKELVDLYLTS